MDKQKTARLGKPFVKNFGNTYGPMEIVKFWRVSIVTRRWYYGYGSRETPIHGSEAKKKVP